MLARVRPILLIVDDDALVRWSLRTVFGERFDLREAASVEQALDVIRADPEIHVAIIDVEPDRGRLTLLREVKALHPRSRVLVLSAESSSEVRIDALRNGADVFVDKPFHLSRLMTTVAALTPAEL